MNSCEIVPTENGWEVKEEGKSEPLDTCWTEKHAMGVAAQVFHKEGALVRVYSKDGTLKEERVLGGEPLWSGRRARSE